ncbi:MAG TPA: HAMP domain-containing sensor histidine kinase [Burkholderiaceae bacterium]|nr:HAMP domain-containing sensor histidine kinase [Burkholderiaceae bacterium]
MTVRLRLALTIFITGVCTALGVLATVAMAFQRFEHETAYVRANNFIARVVDVHPDLFDLHARDPEGFIGFLRNLLLFEPDTQLYLLDARGTVMAASGRAQPKPGFRVRLDPVMEAVATAGDRRRAAYVMGDDPEHMNVDAVIAARPLRHSVIRPDAATAGYLYLVSQPPGLDAGRAEVVRSSLAGSAMSGLFALIVVLTAAAAWVVITVTRPLRDLSDAVARAQRDGFDGAAIVDSAAVPNGRPGDEFAQLRTGFNAMLARLRSQWDALRRLDQFRRESVSNLSHDLRSPLTATVACLETLDRRWAADPARGEDRAMLEVALRNTRNAAQLVRALGDLALLDEPEFKLQPMTVELGEVLDDIVMRFADRAAQQGVTLQQASAGDAVFAAVDIELFERAVANLVDNALKHTEAGGHVTLQADGGDDGLRVTVADTGRGIAAHDLEHLFDRLYTGSGARGDADGKGLGLAIVKRIVELHRGEVSVRSEIGRGTEVTIRLPSAGTSS